MECDLAYRRWSCFVTDSSLQENFYVATQHHCAVFFNQDTFEYYISCTPFQDPCSLRNASWAVGRRGGYQQISQASRPVVHINNECSKRRSVCIVLLLLIRDVFSGALNKAVERETPSGDGSCRTSPIEVGVVSR